MSATLVPIAGLAAPTCSVENVHGRLEFIAPGAFRQQIRQRHPKPFLNFDDHDAPPVTSQVELFASDEGLWFLATVPKRTWDRIGSSIRGGRYSFASIEMAPKPDSDIVSLAGQDVVRITRADVRHICVTWKPCYRATAVWCPLDIASSSRADPLIKMAAARWGVAYARHLAMLEVREWAAKRRAEAAVQRKYEADGARMERVIADLESRNSTRRLMAQKTVAQWPARARLAV